MKILFCTSPHLDHPSVWHNASQCAQTFVPLGLLSLAACLERDFPGIGMDIVDINDAINTDVVSPRRQFYREAAAYLAARGEFDVLALMTDCDSYHHLLQICAEYKRLRPRAFVVLGGPQATAVSEETINHFPQIDAVVRSEGERTIVNLVRALQDGTALTGVNGITFRQDGKVVRTPDQELIANLDDLPIPAYHLFLPKPYASVYLEVGRGCPYQCRFCFTSPYWQRKFRMKSVGRVLAEVDMLQRQYGVTRFNLTHDLFTADRKWVMDFCQAILDRDMHFPWTCSSRTDTIDEEMLTAMSQAGCSGIYYGLESGSTGMQSYMEKNLDLERAKQIVRFTASTGVNATVGFIAGFPEETEADLAKTFDAMFDFYRSGASPVYLFRLCPFNGSKLFAENKENLFFDGHFMDFPVPPAVHAENLRLIASYPQVFSNFQRVKTPGLDTHLLRGMDEVAPIIDTLKYPIMAMLDQFPSPLAFYRRWDQWITSRHAETPSGLPSGYGTAHDFLDFLGDLVESGVVQGDHLRDLLRYEAVKDEYRSTDFADRVPGALAPATEQAGQPVAGAVPKLSGRARLVDFAYDIADVLRALQLCEPVPAKKPTTVLFTKKGVGNTITVKVGRRVAKALALCDGTNRIADIVARLKADGLNDEQHPLDAAAVAGLLRPLVEAGAVEFFAEAEGA